MLVSDFAYFKQWFTWYLASCYNSCPDEDTVKFIENHAWCTCKEISRIGEQMSLGESDLFIAQSCALFHVFGLLARLVKKEPLTEVNEPFGSTNVKATGVSVLDENRILDRLAPPERDIIRNVLVNYLKPKDLNPRELFFCHLLGDADRLDALNVISGYNFAKGDRPEGPFINYNKLPAGSCSSVLLKDLMQGKPAIYEKAGSVDDLKLVHLGWLYNLNFAPACHEALEKKYVEQLCHKLPFSTEIEKLEDHMVTYLKSRVRRPIH